MSLHHVRLVHGSPPNPSNDRRIGFAILYIPTDIARLAGEDSATRVRGEHHHHNFMPEPHPSRELDPEFVALHRAVTECRPDPLSRCRNRQLQRAEGAGAARLNRPGSGQGAESSGLNLCQVCAILSNVKVCF
jgi:hypothetical protein